MNIGYARTSTVEQGNLTRHSLRPLSGPFLLDVETGNDYCYAYDVVLDGDLISQTAVILNMISPVRYWAEG